MLELLAAAGGSQGCSVTERLLQTAPLLEAFGNAAMERNMDSSRFGKLYKAALLPRLFVSPFTSALTTTVATTLLSEEENPAHLAGIFSPVGAQHHRL